MNLSYCSAFWASSLVHLRISSPSLVSITPAPVSLKPASSNCLRRKPSVRRNMNPILFLSMMLPNRPKAIGFKWYFNASSSRYCFLIFSKSSTRRAISWLKKRKWQPSFGLDLSGSSLEKHRSRWSTYPSSGRRQR